MTPQTPEGLHDNLHEVLADSGVAFVLCPHLPGTYAHGAIFWLRREKAVVMMTLGYKRADIFWFSLFHELGHILLHHNRQAVIPEGIAGDKSFNKQEAQADLFAADTLIPPMSYQEFVKRRRFYPVGVERFASQLGISPGIVVGRLQNDKYLNRSWHNRLRTRFDWGSTERS